MSRTFRRPLVLLRPQILGNLKVHQRLSQDPDTVPKKIDIPRHLGLAQQIRQCHPEIVGHRCGSPFVFLAESRIMRTTRWPTSSTANPKPIYTLTGTLTEGLPGIPVKLISRYPYFFALALIFAVNWSFPRLNLSRKIPTTLKIGIIVILKNRCAK
jgi:hypothetical protein